MSRTNTDHSDPFLCIVLCIENEDEFEGVLCYYEERYRISQAGQFNFVDCLDPPQDPRLTIVYPITSRRRYQLIYDAVFRMCVHNIM